MNPVLGMSGLRQHVQGGSAYYCLSAQISEATLENGRVAAASFLAPQSGMNEAAILSMVAKV